MLIIRSIEKLKELKKPTALAIGIFDGLHLGHQRVIKTAIEEAKSKNLLCAVLTFRTFGDNIVKKDVYKEKIISETIFFDLLEEMGVDVVVALPFEEIKMMTADEFVTNVIKAQFDAKFVCCGEDFHFGKGAKGDLTVLKELCAQKGIIVKAAKLVLYGGEAVSSTRIRENISSGQIPNANDMLGHRYSIDFRVEGGNRIGRTLGTPTINQPYPENYVIPRRGVYATLTKVDGKWYTGVTNVGTKPTIGNYDVLAETYIQDFVGNLYGERILVSFLQFLRKEQKFESLNHLREAIEQDSIEAKNIGSLYLE